MYIGKLNFFTHTRPDFSFIAQTLSRYMQTPRTSHMKALQHVLRYVKGTLGHGILLKGTDNIKVATYSDSNWCACPASRRSIIGYFVMLGFSPVRWKSKKQSTVAKSSTEAEYRALSQTASEVTWVVRLLEELGLTNLKPATLFCDNQSEVHIAKNPMFHERTKRIGIYLTYIVISQGKKC